MDVPASDSLDSSFKQKFEQKLTEYEKQHQGTGNKKKPWTRERISEVINHLKQAKINMESKNRRSSMEYYWMSKYEILYTDNGEHLIFKKKMQEDQTIQIIPREEYFEMLTKIHNACGHAGRDKMLSSFNTQYYITKKAVETFISLCPTCEIKRNKKEFISKKQESVSQDSYVIGQVDVIDFQYCPDSGYKWLLKYQDRGTKFLNLRPLQTNGTNEVALELMKIFTTFGEPNMIYFNNGTEFMTEIIRELTVIWPNCKINNGSYQLQQIQDDIIQHSHDVVNMLRSWMNENRSTNWSFGCYFVQYQMNCSLNPVIGKSAYQALFGCKPSCSISSSVITNSVLSNIKSEILEVNVDMPFQNTSEQQCSDNIVKRNSDKQQFGDNSLNNVYIKEEIKIEFSEWTSTDHDGSKEDDTEFQKFDNHRGIKRELETIEDDDMQNKRPPSSIGDTHFVSIPKV